MKKATAITTVLLCFLMASCQTSAQKQANTVMENLKITVQKLGVCEKDVSANPMYRPLGNCFPSGGNAPTLMQLTNKKLPTDEEVQLIISWHNDRARCRVIRIEGLMNSVPGLVPSTVEHYYDTDLVLADLIERKITWGEANKKFHALNLEFQQKWTQIAFDFMKELTASHQAELAQRQAAYNSLQQWRQNQEVLRQNQQMIDSLNRPVITDCTRLGNSVHCTSR